MKCIAAALVVLGVLGAPAAAPAHQGREFVIAYQEGDPGARLMAHVCGMAALDRLGFDVKILSLPAGEVVPAVADGKASLGVRPFPPGKACASAWEEEKEVIAARIVLWGRYGTATGCLGLLVPEKEFRDLRFEAVASVLGTLLARLHLDVFDALSTILLPEGRLSGPLRRSLEDRGLL